MLRGKQLTPQYYDIRILLGQRIPFQQMLNNEKYHSSRLFEVDPFYYSNSWQVDAKSVWEVSKIK